MDILDKLVKTIEYMGKSHDFNESTSMLYVFDAINEIKELRTKLAERKGWKLVPIKPTQQMLKAQWDIGGSPLSTADMSYRAMVRAAPQPNENG